MTLKQLFALLDDNTRSNGKFEVFYSKTNTIVNPDEHMSRQVKRVGVVSQTSLFDHECDGVLAVTI